MGADLPMFTAVVARLPAPEIHLAAFGSVVFPISLLIEAPVIMLLAASTTLVGDTQAYRRVHRFTHGTALVLTVLHALIAFTGLFDVVSRDLIGVPDEVLEPARLGLAIMTPWTWAIASRRFQQGVLIRTGHSRSVAVGTALRLLANAGVLAAGFFATSWPGVAVGCAGIIAGVLTEALFIAWRTRAVELPALAANEAPLSRGAFLRFYTPLALTPFLTLAAQPLGAAAMARMPLTLASLAAWPAVHGLVFLTRSLGIAYNEVVVTLLREPGAARGLRSFQTRLLLGATSLLLLFAWTPLGAAWFASISGLPADLVELSKTALVFALALPACSVLHSWYQGVLLSAGRSRPITEAVGLSLLVSVVVFALGIRYGDTPGIHVTLLGLGAGALAQAAWLAFRARAELHRLV